MTKRRRSSKETAATRARPRTASAKTRAGTEPAPVKTDDPAKDKTEMDGSVLQPLPHAD